MKHRLLNLAEFTRKRKFAAVCDLFSTNTTKWWTLSNDDDDDNDDGDDDENELILLVWLANGGRLALFPASAIVRDPHYCESPTHRVKDLNLHRT